MKNRESITRPNVLLLIADSLRADEAVRWLEGDHERNESGLKQLARRGASFDRAYAAGPNSSLSHAALFSGRYPSRTGIIGNDEIDATLPLIATHLRRNGYKTFGAAGPSMIRSDWGYGRGFEEYFESYYEHVEPTFDVKYLQRVMSDRLVFKDFIRTALGGGEDDITSLKFDLLAQRVRNLDAPWFCFANFLTTHTPYNPPRPYKETFVPDYRRPRLFFIEHFLELAYGRCDGIDRDEVRLDRIHTVANGEGQAYFGDSSYLNESEMEVLKGWYRASIAYFDHQLSTFLNELRESGALENTIVVVTGDHGEYFGEHDLLYHPPFLYEAGLHVPLLISGPGVPNEDHRKDLVSLVDVFPTICNLCDLPVPSTVDGHDVFSGSPRTAVFAETGMQSVSPSLDVHLSDARRRQFEQGKKAIRTEEGLLVNTSGGDRLYFLPEDTEPVPASISQTKLDELEQQLINTLGSEFAETGDPDSDTDDEAVLRNLRDLGYID